MGAASTSQIIKLFYSHKKTGAKMGQNRLLMMHKEKYLKRQRTNINSEYCYYVTGSQQIHQLIRTEFYIKLIELGGVIRRI